MMKRKPVTVLLACLAFALQSVAQSYTFKHFTTNDGLVQTDITDIKQDRKGNIWIGTNGGISVFDGRKFTNYDDHDLLQSLRINAMLCDNSGTMWIATGNGLLKYENDFEVFFKPNKQHRNLVSSLTTNSKNTLVFVCNNVIYQVKDKKVEKFEINQRIENEADYVAFDREDNLWIVTADLKVYKKAANVLTSIHSPITFEQRKQGLNFLKILGKEGPAPYFVTNFGTLWADGDSLCFLSKQYPQYHNARIGQATYVLEENDSTVWIGGVVGLSKLTEHQTVRYVKDNGFCDNSVSAIFTDRERNMWIGTTYNGVYKLSNEALFHLQPKNESFDLRHVSDIRPISPTSTLISTWGKGLYLFNGDSISKIRLPNFLRYISSILEIDGFTYMGWFGKGLWRLNNKTLDVSLVENFGKEEAIAMMEKVRGQLLIQTLDNSCYLTDYHFNIKRTIRVPEGILVTVVKDKIYRLNLFGQVDVLDDDLKVVKRNIFPEISSRITEIVCYRDQLLVGTFGQGIFLYNKRGQLEQKLDKKTGLTTNIITGLVTDGNQVYMGSNLGLIRADLPDLKNVKVFKESEGMFSWECRQGGLKKLPDGGIMIATTNGPYIYYPHKDKATQLASGTLSIAGMRYGEKNDKQFSFASVQEGVLTLPQEIEYKDNSVIINLCGISQRNPSGIVYHYQLSGFDSGWVTTKNPEIRFSNLNPGNYRFTAYLSIGNYQSRPVTLSFAIDKPLSGKLWFQVLLILFLSALCWLLLTIGNRIYQKYIQARMVNKLESDIAHKQELTARSISFAQHNYKELSDALRIKANEKNLEHLTPIFLKDISRRIELLWQKDSITLGDFHQYFDELLAEYAPGARVYHKFSVDGLEIPMSMAFHLLQTFSLYFFIGLYKSETAVFSLDSENKSNGQLLMRFYNITHEAVPDKSSTYHFLKETIQNHRHSDLTIDVIENLEYGNMIIAELNLQNEYQL